MNDFETVRESIYGPGSKRGLAALDRIEAEVERLRTEAGANRLLFEAAQKELELQVAEVERLRAANDVLKGDIHELSQREERLRVVLGHLVAVDDADWSGMDRGWTDVVNEARAALAKEEASA